MEPTIAFKKLDDGLGVWLSNVQLHEDNVVRVLIPWKTCAQIMHALIAEGFVEKELRVIQSFTSDTGE